MSQRQDAAQRRFREGIARAVGFLGGDRAAQEASGISKSVWYDAKHGRSVPDAATTWPAMRPLLCRIPVAVTGVRDWDDLYAMVSPRGAKADPPPAGPTAPEVPPPRQLPPGRAGFVARGAESAALDGLLLRSTTSTVPIAVVSGPPGVGKTAFAVRWARLAAHEFPDGVLYADMRGWGPDRPAAVEEVLPGWMRALGLDPSVSDRVGDRAAMLRSALETRRVLVVLDNARSEEQVRLLLPASPSCSVLITSRHRMPGLFIHHGAGTITLEPLTEQDSISLLHVVLGERVDREPEAAAVLARLCGRLPLALCIVAEMAAARPGTSLATLAAELGDTERRLCLMESEDLRSDLRTVFSWSLAQIPEEIAVTFRRLGLFCGSGLHPDAVAALAGATPVVIAAQLRTLIRMHLAQENAADRVELHDLVRLYASELAAIHDDAADAQAALKRLIDYYLLTLRRADELIEPLRYRLAPPDGDITATPLHSQSEALAWLDAESANVVTLCSLDSPAIDAERWHLAFLARGYFFRAKRLHEWVSSHEYALEAALRLEDPRAEAMTRSNLGLALHESGDDAAALPHYEAARRLFERIGDRHGVSNTLAHEAAVLRHRGDFGGSLRLNEQALAIYREVGNPRNVAITLRGIGFAELELGRLGNAERHLAESLDLCTALNMHMDAARAGNTLGRVHLLAGRWEESGRAFRAAIDADRASGGRFETALALRGLGAVALAAGRHSLAEQHWREALGILEELGSPKTTDVAADLAALEPGGDRDRADVPDQEH